ncbi:cytochrome c biogenesis protein CcdA [Kribbella sp. VKM Ac-2527]|uniref:Cytochrome c biogenesis protein CcdA n=1 Tax=Kribbella caucasensis TaxID=2512215 RepID=A0A4R6J3G3_9ACTN|nr:cytochrome c biogenesis CcdA family protein [Kribbella sp. VKM Ac-2527]TDO29869.1 cytochrome c biogenesis protein CcdA [Kribbella sp. VKM Ac-2527]
MPDGLLAIALGAGMLAAVNPCGFALLPAYLSLLVTGDQPPNRATAVGRALVLSAGMTLGFAAVFGVFGLAVAPVASSVQRYLPWFTIGLGLLLAGVGAWLLAGRPMPTLALHRRGPADLTRSLRSMIAYGASYAIASLSCTIAPFLAVVVSSYRADSIWAGAALFLAYAGGMGLVVATAAVAVAPASTSLVGRLRRAGATVPKIAGLLLVASGGYVAYYGWWEIRTLRGDLTTDDPVIDTASAVQHHLANTIDRLGLPGIAALLALVLTIAGLTWARGPRSRRNTTARDRAVIQRRITAGWGMSALTQVDDELGHHRFG